jgi:imidazolonepropionase-like amidohydrolase
LLYTVEGSIRQRNFNSWSSRIVPFRATVQPPEEVASIEQPERELSSFDVPTGRLIVRSSRLFDGIGGGYQNDIDIIVEDGRIVALEPRQDRPGEVLVDLGDVTALPGFIDSYAALPDNFDNSLGALLLSLGVTTIIAEHAAAVALDEIWSGKETPGPRILNAGDAATVAALRRGTDSFADANTPGISNLLDARQAALLPEANPARRFAELPDLQSQATRIVVGSKPNALPPGLALHGEFLALSAAGLNGEQVLRSAGVNAAAYLKFGLELGRIAPGARADLVLVDGDPLQRTADLQKVVGIVRNGRFFSAIGLIERATANHDVE